MTRAVPGRIEYAWTMRPAVALFCCSLIATFGACGGNVQTESSATVGACTYNDRQYPAGSTFSPDSCNTCNCTSAGEAFCTHRTCAAPVDAGAGGSLSYMDASTSGGSSEEATCTGFAAVVIALDASVPEVCVSTALSVVINAQTPDPCSWPVPVPPAGSVFQLDRTQLFYLPNAGGTRELPQAESLSRCSGVVGGWYFDDPTAPTTIQLCPCTCAVMTSDDQNAQLLLRMGCSIHSIFL
jgi:hypothetical protein